MAVIDLEVADRKIWESDFWRLRGLAVQAYASLEQSLCRVMALSGDIDPEAARIVFFKITNADARNAIIEKLLRKKFDGKYSKFWNSFLRVLKATDKRRNEIVHWNALSVVSADESGETTVRLRLRPGADRKPFGEGRLEEGDLAAFIIKCDLLERTLNMFYAAHSGTLPDAETAEWLVSFADPFIYPPPPDSKFAFSSPRLGGFMRDYVVGP